MYRFSSIFEIGVISGLLGLIADSIIAIQVSYSILIFLIIVDTIVGVMSAKKTNRFSSAGLRKIVYKVVTYSLSIIVVRALELIIMSIYKTTMLTNTIIAFLALTEVVSVMENLTILGVPISSRILAILFALLKIGDYKPLDEQQKETKDYLHEIDDIIKYQLPDFSDVREMEKLALEHFSAWRNIVKQIDESFKSKAKFSNEYVYYKIITIIEIGIKDFKLKCREEALSQGIVEDCDIIVHKITEKLKHKIREISYSNDDITIKKEKIIESIIAMLYKYILEAQKTHKT